jgi:signal transduction histidine kinase/CheY-like chemotaxis protein
MAAAAGLTALASAARGRQQRRARLRLESEVARRTAELRERTEAIARQAAQLEEQSRALREVDAAKTRFVASLSHELRTPLMLVMDPLAELAESEPGAAGERLRIALRNARRLQDLVEQLFTVVRLDGGRLPLRARRLAVEPFLRDLVDRHRPLAEDRGLSVSVEAAPVEVWADRDLLEQAVGNLIGNALKFTPRGGRIGLSAAAAADRIVIEVADDGPGVAPQDAERIFERWTRAEPAQAEGAGIGLSLAREIAELHGGELTLAPSERGARFVLALPSGADHLSVSEVALDDPGPASPSAPPAPGKRRILVVEDHPELRAWLAARLGEEFAVELAVDGAEALARLEASPPDLVLSDIMMPKVDGLSLCRSIRANPHTASLPVILLSAKGRATEPEARAAGADLFLPKPVRTSALLEALRARLPSPEPPVEVEEAPGPRTELEAEWIGRLEALVRQHLADPDLSVERLAKQVGMSRRTLQRALNRLLGQSPNTWLQELRLAHGREVLLRGGTVGEAAGAVGLSPSYFARLYRAWFGYPPSEESPREPSQSTRIG